MNAQSTTEQKPTLVNVIAWMTLASGIVNLIWGLVASAAALHSFIGVICIPFTILPTVLGIFEVIYAAKLLSFPPQPVKPSTAIAILEIVDIIAGNIFSMVVGILALVFYNDFTVREYFARLNGTPVPAAPVAPVMSAEPVSTAESEPVVTLEPNLDLGPDEPVNVSPERTGNPDVDNIAPAGSDVGQIMDDQQPPLADTDSEGETPKG